ncbi:MAG TPA: DUF2971 domain-containing protein [Mucilaginibacter sp.]|jgi:hypothetical protein|nr:DUF2971 domain-containing protein [Mucilaginibacter sp.]
MALRQFPDGYYKQFIPKTGIPTRIYKYNSINDNLLNSLKDGYLWFSKPLDFNDPFDCWTALIDFSEPEDYLKKLAKDRFAHLPRNERRNNERKLMKQSHRATGVYRLLIDKTAAMMGVCCFTTKNDHILMWSHYAEKHQGICLEFDPLVQLDYFLTAEVHYTDQFQPLNYFKSDEDALIIMAITKSTVWEYEGEIRVLRPTENGKQFFNKSALTGVIFGCKTPVHIIDDIRKLLTDSGYHNVSFRQATMAKDRFQLSIEDLH